MYYGSNGTKTQRKGRFLHFRRRVSLSVRAPIRRRSPSRPLLPSLLALSLSSSGRATFDTMADYWVSRKKWTCKYCDITINDDLPSRQQHEGGFRHKNNVERALKDIYRKSEQDKRDKEHARREMLKIERVSR